MEPDATNPARLLGWTQRPLAITDASASPLKSTDLTTLLLYARKNPSLAKLVTGYEEWASQYKKEAEERLGGFKPLQQLLDSNERDWELLRRVKTHSPLFQSNLPRSASEGTIISTDASTQRRSGQRVHLGRQQENADWLSAFDPENNHGRLVHADDTGLSEAEQSSRFPRVKTAPALRDGPVPSAEDDDATSSASANSSSSWINSDDGARQLEAVAARLLQQSRQAIQSAQHTLQETANNCQANLQTLGALLQQVSMQTAGEYVVSGRSSNGNGGSSGLQVVPWYRGHHGSPEPSWDMAKQHKPSLQDPGRSVAIVTTASLPWMTGTAVNPLLRAAYLSDSKNRQVTLLLPWLSKMDQERVFPNSIAFDSPADQEAFVREWAQKRTGLACDFKVRFYPGRYAPEKGSILPVGDITQYIPDAEADVAVLEEPEHLNWYHHGRRWTDKFRHVVGVMHTNYLDYARREERGQVKEALLKHINAWVCRIYCHKVIKLSDAVQQLPRQETMFVHGVSPAFLQVGQDKASAASEGKEAWGKGAYFLGKVLWAKGYTELLERLREHSSATGQNVEVDVYGTGPDLQAVQEAAASQRLNLHFNGARDHADSFLQDYKVFINPSLSDVVATTTAEALAMGKFVVCADHPSNKFFSQFPNCLIYRTPQEFSRCLQHAMNSDPMPLSTEHLRKLTWEDATHRFLQVAELQQQPQLHEQLLDNFLAAAHQALTSMEPLRVLAGAGAGTRDSPASVTDYVPSEADVLLCNTAFREV
eukprot:gene13587-13712_t